ncbi:hypothetical protein LSAT2_009879 [Lamellibrachia satsuma]|nr:hypothetical protein LSAT2_009879 [Lamellibrachia satsuma]
MAILVIHPLLRQVSAVLNTSPEAVATVPDPEVSQGCGELPTYIYRACISISAKTSDGAGAVSVIAFPWTEATCFGVIIRASRLIGILDGRHIAKKTLGWTDDLMPDKPAFCATL